MPPPNNAPREYHADLLHVPCDVREIPLRDLLKRRLYALHQLAGGHPTTFDIYKAHRALTDKAFQHVFAQARIPSFRYEMTGKGRLMDVKMVGWIRARMTEVLSKTYATIDRCCFDITVQRDAVYDFLLRCLQQKVTVQSKRKKHHIDGLRVEVPEEFMPAVAEHWKRYGFDCKPSEGAFVWYPC